MSVFVFIVMIMIVIMFALVLVMGVVVRMAMRMFGAMGMGMPRLMLMLMVMMGFALDLVAMTMPDAMRLFVILVARVGIMIVVVMFIMIVVMVPEMHIKLCARHVGALATGGVQVIFLQPEFRQFTVQLIEVHSQIQHRADEHVAADPAKYIQIDRPHDLRSLDPVGLRRVLLDGLACACGNPLPVTPDAASAAKALI